MIIPELKRSNRVREYNQYSTDNHRDVLIAYLFDGLSHRQIDSEVLDLDNTYSRGYQSMGILHYLGITGSYKGLFNGMTIDQAIVELRAQDENKYRDIIQLLEKGTINEVTCEEDIQAEIAKNYVIQSEGRRKQYYTTRYERKASLRKQAIEIHKPICMACGFDFSKTYGERGKDYIEVHHIKPLAHEEDEVLVDPKEDLITVCANCHRMIHRKKNEVLSLDELRIIIRRNK